MTLFLIDHESDLRNAINLPSPEQISTEHALVHLLSLSGPSISVLHCAAGEMCDVLRDRPTDSAYILLSDYESERTYPEGKPAYLYFAHSNGDLMLSARSVFNTGDYGLPNLTAFPDIQEQYEIDWEKMCFVSNNLEHLNCVSKTCGISTMSRTAWQTAYGQ